MNGMLKEAFDSWKAKWPTLDEAKARLAEATKAKKENDAKDKKEKEEAETRRKSFLAKQAEAEKEKKAPVAGGLKMPDVVENDLPYAAKELIWQLIKYTKKSCPVPLSHDSELQRYRAVSDVVKTAWFEAHMSPQLWAWFKDQAEEMIDEDVPEPGTLPFNKVTEKLNAILGAVQSTEVDTYE